MSILEEFIDEFIEDICDLNFCVSSKPFRRFRIHQINDTGLFILFKYSKLIDLNIFNEISYIELKQIIVDILANEDVGETIYEAALCQANIKGNLIPDEHFQWDFSIRSLNEPEEFHQSRLFTSENFVKPPEAPNMGILEITTMECAVFSNHEIELFEDELPENSNFELLSKTIIN